MKPCFSFHLTRSSQGCRRGLRLARKMVVFTIPQSVLTDLDSLVAGMFPQTSCGLHVNHTPLISSHLISAVCVCAFAFVCSSSSSLNLSHMVSFHAWVYTVCAYTVYHVAVRVWPSQSVCISVLSLYLFCAFSHIITLFLTQYNKFTLLTVS